MLANHYHAGPVISLNAIREELGAEPVTSRRRTARASISCGWKRRAGSCGTGTGIAGRPWPAG